MRGSIRQRLTLAFIALAVGPLLLIGGALAWQSFVTQQQQALNLQREVAQRVSTQVTAFFAELEAELRLISQVQGLPKLERAKQKSILTEVLSYQDVFDALILLDSQGQELVRVTRLSATSTELGNRAQADEFVKPKTSGQTYYSPVWFDKTTGEPFMTIAVPMVDARSGLVESVLVADTRIKKIWDLIANLQISPGQSAYIVDAQGKVVAHRNPSVVLQGTTFQTPKQDGTQPGLASVNPMLVVDTRAGLSIQTLVAQLTSPNVVLAVDRVRLGEQEFNIVAEQTVAEALALAINTILITAGLIVVVLIVSVILGFFVVRQIIGPIQTLAATAQAISTGDLSQQVLIVRQDELGILANAFNGMTAQLRTLIGGLEQEVAERKQAQAQVEHSLREARVRYQVSQALAGQETEEEVLDALIKQAGLYPQASVSLLTFDRQTGEDSIVRRFDTFESGFTPTAPPGTRFPAVHFPMIKLYSADQPFISNDIAADERIELPTRQMLVGTGTASIVAFPLTVGSKWLGFINVISKFTDYFDQDKQLLYQALAEQGAAAMETAILRDEIRTSLTRRGFQVQTSTDIAQEIAAAPALNELFYRVVTLIKERLGYYHVQLLRHDPALNAMVLVTGYGEAGQKMLAADHKMAMGHGLVGRAAATGQSILVANVTQDQEWQSNPNLPDTKGEIAVPIKLRDQVLGILDVQSDQAGLLSAEDQLLLEGLCGQIAVAMTNAQLFEQIQQRAAELTTAKEEAELAKEKAEQAKEEAEQARQDIEIANKALETQVWQTAGQTQLNEQMRGEQNIPTLARNVIQQLCHYLNAPVGTLYVLDNNMLKLAGSYAYTQPHNLPAQFRIGESLVGQAALEKQPLVITQVADDYIVITSSLGTMSPKNIWVAPFIYDGQVSGVIELGTLTALTSPQLEFLQKTLENIAIVFNTAQARVRINELLAETQQQAEELQLQEEELRAANEELEAQTESLRTSETKLKANQAELEATNAELEEKAEVLQQQQTLLDQQNQELKTAQQELQRRAEELTLASKYKSEFLANMSHELRTPLNSLLILAGMLAKNEQQNLTPDQVESAQIIYSGGTDLLNLINDILDLSKIEAGKVEFRFAPMPLERLISTMRSQFTHVAEEKGLEFEIRPAENTPEMIETDQQRVEQIIKNLLSNAFKFTHQGRVSLVISRPEPAAALSKNGLDPAQTIAFQVTDTGIGMTPEQQKIVFEAFQQADGSTSRQYGGTGLGLSISRELAAKLGGRIELESEKGQGSTFTLYLPIGKPKSPEPEGQTTKANLRERRMQLQTPPGLLPVSPPTPTITTSPPAASRLPDDRADLQPGDRVLLIIEDDPKFAKVAYDYAHKKRFKCLVAGDGETGLKLAQTYRADAVILDLNLPGISGWEVLDTLKNDPNTRHIPVHIMSVSDEDLDAYKRGAMGFLSKPVSQEDLENSFQRMEQFIARKIKTLLLVEDDTNLRKSVRKLLEGNDITISEASLGQAALDQLALQSFDCMILDLNLPDMSGFELLSRLDTDEKLFKCPVIVYTGKALTEEENRELLRYADSIIVKGVKSPERLLDETALFLHRVIANMPEEKQRTIKQLYDKEAMLVGKAVLIVDDDTRNAFALSKLLADKGLKVHIAINGQKALDLLDKTPVDLVLMDIMMPGMDGYEATRCIRAQQRFHNLPILALTAKAMKGDREKCLEAGANDYLSKPIDADRLFSMLRVWLNKA